MQTQEITVAMIHEDFKSAGDRAIKEAQDLLDNPKADMALYAERFAKVGFTSCKAMKEVQDRATAHQKAPEVIEAVRYFQHHYPFQKFITEEGVKSLCGKYNLMLGESANYTGDIPEKNLVDIENFKLREEDYKEEPYLAGLYRYFVPSSNMQPRTSFDEFGFWGGFDPASEGSSFGIIQSKARSVGRQAAQRISSELIARYLSPGMISDVTTHEPEEKKKNTYKPEFMIVAPHADFNTRGYEVRDGYKLVYDPIVLQPVKHKSVEGYLIITAWGEEASDEQVVNQINN